MRRGRIVLAAAILIWSLTGAVSQARSLDGARATVQFSATMTTAWTLGPYSVSEEGCFEGFRHGSGKQVVELRQPGHANVSIVDSGGTIAFQLPLEDRAGPTKRALGFPQGRLERDGVSEIDFSYAKNTPSRECGAPPAPEHDDESGCGLHALNWDISPLVSAGRIYPNVATFPEAAVLVRCPFSGVVGKTDPNPTTLPVSATFQKIGAAAVRSALRPRHGKLIVQGKDTWKSHTEGTELSASTSLAWKLTIIRAS